MLTITKTILLQQSKLLVRNKSTSRNQVICFVNGEKQILSSVEPDETALDVLRRKLSLTGTKLTCGEGGCGACVADVARWEFGDVVHRSVNTCLMPAASLDGASVTTIEGIAPTSAKSTAADPQQQHDLHPVQASMAKNFASQCGFCTPGFVMSMYSSLTQYGGKMSAQQLAKSIDGNLCRCTGYRPISDSVRELTSPEVANEISTLSAHIKADFPSELVDFHANHAPLNIQGSRASFYAPTTFEQLLEARRAQPDAKVVSGNTEVGIEQRFGRRQYKKMIGVTHTALQESLLSAFVSNLSNRDCECVPPQYRTDDGPSGMFIGAAMPLTDIDRNLESLMSSTSNNNEKIIAKAIRDQLYWFAGTSLRNVATLGGNIVTASPISDLNPVFVALDAHFLLASSKDSNQKWLPAAKFFGPDYRQIAMDPSQEVLVGVYVPAPPIGADSFTQSFKQTRRREDDIAIVNACMSVHVDDWPNSSAISHASIAFGGMGPSVVQAPRTAKFLVDNVKDMRHLISENPKTQLLDKTLKVLYDEIKFETADPPGGMKEYRESLALGFLKKFAYSLVEKFNQKGNDIPLQCHSINKSNHPDTLPTGSQRYAAPSSSNTIGHNVIHQSSVRQVTGQAVYTDDLPRFQNELQAALVISRRPGAKITSIDTSGAFDGSVQGVRGFYTAKDVPGSNRIGDIVVDEYCFADDHVSTVGQVIGVVVAESDYNARLAVDKIKVHYEDDDDTDIALSIQEGIRDSRFLSDGATFSITNTDEQKLEQTLDGYERIKGRINIGAQEHFYFEPQTVLAQPTDSEMLVYTSTQNPNKTQTTVAKVLGWPSHRVRSTTRRIGGGFGGKETDSIRFASIAAIAAHHEQCPVRLVLDRDQDIETTGKRHAFYAEYEASVDPSSGKIKAADIRIFNNAGNWHDLSFPVLQRALFHSDNAYDIEHFRTTGKAVQTNTISNTAFRGFGGVQGMLVAESLVNQVAEHIGMEPEKVREINMYASKSAVTPYGQSIDVDLVGIWNQLKRDADFEKRRDQVVLFNRENEFRKRGIAMTPCKFGIAFTATFLNQGSALVHIYTDGSVMLTHGGVEMGQGLTTKVIQVVADRLGVPASQVYFSETSTDKIANGSATAASVGSDLYGMAAAKACDELNERLAVYRKALGADAPLSEIASKAYFDRVNLSAHGFYKIPVDGYNFETGQGTPFSYFSSGAACSEVEVDTLTGDYRTLRSDLVMDVGASINPSIDIGQIEGAFVQGLGWLTLEEMVVGDKAHSWAPPGRITTRGPGAYKIPSFDDIPLEFNVSLYEHSPNKRAIASSRGVGEPPYFLSASIYFALRKAILASRYPHNDGATKPSSSDYILDTPLTSERIRMACHDPQITSRFDQEFITKGSF